MTDAVSASEMLEDFYEITRRNTPEDSLVLIRNLTQYDTANFFWPDTSTYLLDVEVSKRMPRGRNWRWTHAIGSIAVSHVLLKSGTWHLQFVCRRWDLVDALIVDTQRAVSMSENCNDSTSTTNSCPRTALSLLMGGSRSKFYGRSEWDGVSVEPIIPHRYFWRQEIRCKYEIVSNTIKFVTASDFSTLRTRIKMVLKTLVFFPFKHLTTLVAREEFIISEKHTGFEHGDYVFLKFWYLPFCLDGVTTQMTGGERTNDGLAFRCFNELRNRHISHTQPYFHLRTYGRDDKCFQNINRKFWEELPFGRRPGTFNWRLVTITQNYF